MPLDRVINSFRSLSLAALFLLFSGGLSAASDPADSPDTRRALTWEQAIQKALAGHPSIKIAEHELLASQAMIKQIESANYPQITGIFANSAGNTRVLANLGISGSLPKPVTYLTTPGVRVDLLITDFGHTAHRILSQRALAASAERTVLTTKALTILNVQQAYLRCLKQQRLIDIAAEILKERELIRDQTEAFHRRELRSKLDLDFASVEVSRAEWAFLRARNDLQQAFAALNNAMGQRELSEYRLDGVPLAVLPAPPLEALFPEALASRPELLDIAYRIQAADEALKAARALNYGNITAIGTAGYSWWSGREFDAAGNQTNPGKQLGWWGAGGTSSFPIFTGWRIEGRIEEAQGRKDEQQAIAKALTNDVVLQVAQAYFNSLTARQQITVAEERVAHAREALTLARERYKAGLGSILEVTTATANLLAAETGLADSQYDYRASQAALGFATGKEHERF
ncbi:MAG TPA: TolC family protein [Nitrospiraceae bacterium]|nr:TolC family protein [Nitrospiraceae bacterium]